MLFITREEKRALKRVFPLIEVDIKAFVFSVLLASGALGAAIALGATAAWLIARASEHPPVLFLTVAAVGVRTFGVSRALLRYAGRLASHRVALRGMDALRQNLYHRLAHNPIDRLTAMKRGDLLARTGADVDDLGDLVVKTLLPTCVAVIVGICTVIGLGLISVPAALLVALCLLVSGVGAPLLSMRAARIAQIDTLRARTDLSTQILTVMEGTSELQVSGELETFRASIDEIEEKLVEASHRSARMAALASGIDRAAMGAAVVAALLIGIPQTTGGMITGLLLAVLVLTPLSSFEGTAELAPAGVQLVKSATAAVRIDEMLGESTEVATHPVVHTDVPSLAATNLTIGWPSGPSLVDSIDLELHPGKSIAIVGESGIGKTTLALTLAGMIPPKAGSAQVNGVDAWEADRVQLTKIVNVTTEDAHIFATSVLENLRVANGELSEDSAIALLERVGLASWLAALPDGIHTMIGSDGTTVSGGERRRLLIARGLASPAPLLLLDEAGEHLDASTADALISNLLSDPTRGILLISHRLSALENADEILFFGRSGGERTQAELIARGTHADLLETSQAYRWAVGQEEEN